MNKSVTERIEALREEIKKCEEMEAEYRACAERMTQLITLEPQSKARASSKVEEYTVKMLETEAVRRGLELELMTAEMELSERIAQAIKEKQVRIVMKKRYVEGKSWRAIGKELKCSARQAMRQNRKGLKNLNLQERASV